MNQSPVLIAVPEHPVKPISWKTNESPRAFPQRLPLDAVTGTMIVICSDSILSPSTATFAQRCPQQQPRSAVSATSR
jgi:hypothetical protein